MFPLVYLALAFKNYFILELLEKMEPGHIYYKAIKPDIGSYSLTKVSDKQKLKEISKKIQDLVKKNKELKTDLKISNPETKDLIITSN